MVLTRINGIDGDCHLIGRRLCLSTILNKEAPNHFDLS